MIKCYARRPDPRQPHSRGVPVGVIIGESQDGVIRLGYSRCNPLDQFSKARGSNIALARLQSDKAVVVQPGQENIPEFADVENQHFLDTVQWVLSKLCTRPQRYVNRSI